MKRSILALFLFSACGWAQPAGGCGLSTNRCAGSGQTYPTVQAAWNAAVAGDTVYGFNDITTGFQGISPHVSGTLGNPITVQFQAGGNITVAGDVSGDGINIDTVDYVVIDGPTVTGMTRIGIRVVNSTGSVVKNATVVNATNQGILTGFAPRVQLLNNTISGTVQQHGIYVSNSDTGFDGPIVRGNILHNNNLNGLQVNGDCTTLDNSGNSDGVISGALIERNIAYSNGGKGIALINVNDSWIRNNLLYSNGVSSQVSLADQGGTCPVGSNRNVFTGNTIYTTNSGFRIVTGTGNVFFNNLTVANGFKCVIDAIAVACDGSGSSNTGNNYQAGLDLTTSTITGVFTNQPGSDYTLAASSPAIDIGAVSYLGFNASKTDLLGNTRPFGAGYDVGAYERGASSAGPDTTPPSTPGTPTAVITAYSVGLSWTASTDNVEVLGYIIYRGGVALGVSLTAGYTDTSVIPGTAYAYTVVAWDGAYNLSTASGALNLTVYGQIGCMNADNRPAPNTFRNVLIPIQSADFTVGFSSQPFGPTNSVVGVSFTSPQGFSDMAMIVQFPSSGNILVRNGSSYTADITLPWSLGVNYLFRITGNVTTHLYSVFVTPSSGGGEQTLATNYAFRTEQSAVTSLGVLATNDSGGSLSVCSPTVNGLPITGILYEPVTTQVLATQVSTTVTTDANGNGKPLLDLPKLPVLTGSRPLHMGDNGGLLPYSGSSAIVVTVPTGLPAGFGCTIVQDSTGTVSLVGSGLTLVNRQGATHTAGVGSPAVIQCTTVNNCKLWGDVQ